MSTVMYAYKVKKTEFWNVFDKIRDYYKNNHYILQTAIERAPDDFHGVMKSLRELFNDDCEVNLQLFDFEDHYVFIVRESGYYFVNNLKLFDVEIVEVNYDSRSDIPDEDLKNEAIAREIDNKIFTGHYFLVPLFDYHFVTQIVWDIASKLQE